VLGFLARRLLALVPLVLGVVLLGFAIVQLAPGDPVQVLVGDYPAPPDYVKQVRERFGLDAPRWVQLGRYLGEVGRGNLGHSFFYNQPVWDVLASRIGPTLLLMGSAMALASGAGVLLGVAGGRRPGTWPDHMLMLLGLVGYSLPVFWLGQLLLIGVSIRLDLLPTQGMRTIAFNLSPGARVWDVVLHLILPALTLATRYVALNVRLTRTSLVEVSRMDYLTTARAKGLTERVVVYKHALRNALIPVVTVMGLDVGHLVAGAVLTETVFAWPGLGRLMVKAIFARDYVLLQGAVLIFALAFVIINLLVDLSYGLLDPRVARQG
jgi:peptide/nickel transport system permease protein